MVTVADDASVAATSTKSASAGGAIVLHFFPSVGQQDRFRRGPRASRSRSDGAAPATTCAFALVHCTRQVAPASLDRSTKRPLGDSPQHLRIGRAHQRARSCGHPPIRTITDLACCETAVRGDGIACCWLRARSGAALGVGGSGAPRLSAGNLWRSRPQRSAQAARGRYGRDRAFYGDRLPRRSAAKFQRGPPRDLSGRHAVSARFRPTVSLRRDREPSSACPSVRIRGRRAANLRRLPCDLREMARRFRRRRDFRLAELEIRRGTHARGSDDRRAGSERAAARVRASRSCPRAARRRRSWLIHRDERPRRMLGGRCGGRNTATIATSRPWQSPARASANPKSRPRPTIARAFRGRASEFTGANHGSKLLAAARALGEVQLVARGLVRVERALDIRGENFRIGARFHV